MVGVPEFESGTSSLSGTRSNQLSYTPNGIADCDLQFAIFITANHNRHSAISDGGGKGVRTPDPELAKLVLYQLSYAPAAFAKLHPAWGIAAPGLAQRFTTATTFRTGNGAVCAVHARSRGHPRDGVLMTCAFRTLSYPLFHH